ncbi:MAG: helix-turn-helix domain-containing protein, partial [Bacilli bacterium]|nr:helix-turn-helix domain-containing protein [Bacilli bacterium]
MKDIIIDLMENKVDRRYVKELVTLNEYNRSILIDELEVILNTEKKTIKFDIKNLNEKYDNIINIDENKYVTLLKSSVIIKDIILDIYKNTISYHLIMNAYYNKKVLPYKFVDDHFISYNQLRRYLCYINSVLEAYHIKISSNCLEMIGNESEIQLFYLHYFSYSDIYLVSTNVTIGNDFLKEIMNELVIIGLLSLSVDFYNYAIQIKILLERLIVNKKPIFDSKLIKLTKKRNSYINLTTAIKRAWQKKLTNIIDYNELDDHVLMNFYFILLNSINYTFDTNNQKLKIRNDENIDTLTKFSNLSAPIVKKLLKDTNISNLNKLLVTYLINIYSLSKLTSLYQIRDSRIKKAVIKHYSYSYEIWLNGLEEFVLNNEEINFVYLE